MFSDADLCILLCVMVVNILFVAIMFIRLKKVALSNRIPVSVPCHHSCRLISGGRVQFKTKSGNWLRANVVRTEGKWLAIRRHPAGPVFWGQLVN